MSSPHFKFGNDKTAYRIIQRVDGRPWLQSAITPQNGGSGAVALREDRDQGLTARGGGHSHPRRAPHPTWHSRPTQEGTDPWKLSATTSTPSPSRTTCTSTCATPTPSRSSASSTAATTYTVTEAQDVGGTGAQVLATVTRYYTSSGIGTGTWTLNTQNAASTVVTTSATAQDSCMFTVHSPELSDGYTHVKVASTSTGTVTAIAHDLHVQRDPANLPALSA